MKEALKTQNFNSATRKVNFESVTMDILDIDEALKDDSFICLEDKTHDDVSNILQQWKSNNCLVPAQYQQEQDYKLNSRTFTRPRRKPAQNLEQHFAHTSDNNEPQTPPSSRTQQQIQQQHKFTIATPQPMFNMEIGGLVTTMHKSFLQDTSPPLSICSSMEVSMDRMNNSLITSADFTNVNFLQSTQSLDFNEPMLNGGEYFNLANKATSDGYTLSDMISDRKALESLTLSGDGTLIKDSQIGQIDDISLALSKTASGYSTMDNSTESMQDEHAQQRNGTTGTLTNMNTTTVGVNGSVGVAVDLPQTKCNIMHRTMLLSDDVISDTTFELVESSLCESSDNGIDVAAAASLATSVKSGNETFKKPWPMDETVCLPTTKGNTTFEFKQLTPDTRLTTDTRCETPENMPDTKGGAPKFYESTPHAAGLSNGGGAQQHTPTTSRLTGDDEVNLSPIVGAVETLNATRVLSETFNQDLGLQRVNTKTFSGTLPRLESIEQMLEDIENPNETYEKINFKTQELQLQQQNTDALQMQNVLDLAYAEEELLASNNDQEFEDMLEEFSKVEVNAEHVKMKKSLETIKRRFNRDTVTLTKAPSLQHEGENDELQQKVADMPHDVELSVERSNGSYTRADVNASVESKRSLLSDISAPSGLSTPSPTAAASLATSSAATSITASNGGGGERLLSRRSRLYDNINLSTISSNNHHSPSRILGASFTVHKREDNEQENSSSDANATEASTKYETECNNGEQEQTNFRKTDGACNDTSSVNATTANANNCSGIGTYKLSERRERDRDRFKTIKIVKDRNTSNDGLIPVNVPCIDDDDDNYITSVENDAVFNNNKSEIDTETENCAAQFNVDQSAITAKPTVSKTSKLNPNFLTYKKPKDKTTNVDNLPDITAPPLTLASNEDLETVKPTEPPVSRLRSRSRPRYISGLQKMTVVKATSAGDLDRASSVGARGPNSSISHATLDDCPETNVTIGAVIASTKFNRNAIKQPIKKTSEEVKSPMGTKSKSFHNLSSNFGFHGNGNGSNALPGPRTHSFGLKKPTVLESNYTQRAVNGVPSNASTQQVDDAVFKVPKLVSGLRAPGVKRAGLVRPSSGFYSLNSLATKGMPPLPHQAPNDTDSDGGRHSPSDSMSSASSRGSLHSGSGGVGVSKPVASKPAAMAAANTLNLTKITTGSTGIPKPSGLRQPTTTTLKRSGLPKPGTATARR